MNILTINQLRERKYSSELKIEQQVKPSYAKASDGEYDIDAYIVSYDSDGLKIYGYLVVPKVVTSHQSLVTSKKSLIIFCHGRIPEPKDYLPERQYARHCEYLASNGFVVFKPDYRGHGNSEGEIETIFESGYTVDVLNSIAALSQLDCFASLAMTVDNTKIGIMGHSLGGNIALKVMEINSNIKAGVIWGGAVISAEEILEKWFSDDTRKSIAEELIKKYGEPKENPEFWKSISPINFVQYINAAILIQHGEKDESISTSQAKQLEQALKQAGKNVELILYKNGTHNFEGKIYEQAIQKATEFFKKSL